MDSIKKKLVELIGCANYHPCKGAVRTIGSMFTTDFIEDIASHLIANSVTVQEWISVKDRLPEKREDVLLCRKWWGEISDPKMGWYNEVSGKWFDLSNMEIHNVTHWMPLPQPPKEE